VIRLDGLRLQRAGRKELTENVLQIFRKQYILGCCVPVVPQSLHMYAFMHACIWICVWVALLRGDMWGYGMTIE